MKISVYIPTYKRLEFLKRAVGDVMAQSFNDWELIVSDNEVSEDTDVWRYLKALEEQDARVRVFKNPGGVHDQAHNVNNALSHCSGEWVKPFYDDDRMLPNCLETFLTAIDKIQQSNNPQIKQSNVVMLGCRAQKWRNGKYAGDEENFAQGDIDIIRSADARRAICKFDRWNGRTPQHMLIRRDAILAGATMPVDCSYLIPIDLVWFANILDHGDYAMLSDVLVHQCEGEVASLTGDMRQREADLDKEFFLAYKDVFDGITPEKRRYLSWRAIVAEINGIRGIYHLRCHRFTIGMKMMLMMFYSLLGPLLTIRWLLQKTYRNKFAATKRERIIK